MNTLIQNPEQRIFFSDPGHGWLRVPRSELIELGVMDKISACSYQTDDGQFVFLEEDCDLGVYVDAKGYTHHSQWCSREEYDEDELVRQLPRFHA